MARLDVSNIVMEFPAVRALDGVSLAFEAGEVHGLVGENGAGKSTLMKILSGLQRPTSGEVSMDGAAVHLHGVRDALERGIGMIHQELNLVDDLTVAENVFLGREPTRAGLLDRAAMNEETNRLLAEVRAPFDAATMVGDLSIAGKQLVEIAKALALNASILIMDEPTAVLSEPESEALFDLIRKLKAKGVTVIYISHRLAEVLEICDRVSVLRDGQLVTTLKAEELPDIATLASLMVGRPLSDMYPEKSPLPDELPGGSALGPPRPDEWRGEGAGGEGPPPEAVLLEVRSLCLKPDHPISFQLQAGEILGLAGLVGAGRTELAEALIGVRRIESGEVLIAGQPVRIKSPRDAKRHGIAYVSEDRKGLGLILSLSVIDNTTLANLDSYCHPILDRRAEESSTENWKRELDVRAGDLHAEVLYLSGGNQQKISIAKWLETKPKILVLDEPTRGVDVGAKREMYLLIQKLASEGLGCLVISSELPEIIGLCHRAIVLREGRQMGEVSGATMTEEAIMHLAAGVEAA
ncbi:MAG: sugar ABC transporter ATP-binding protein [Fimbriimonadaceae bacterium]|nr:sugar ABC transporter ATP-binding protein [Fimbriimonadaceae bacterium]